jgi:hypothetical protein
MNSKADYRPMIAQACSDCHNKKTGNNPQVVKEAVVIMQRLTHAEGYRTWAEFYYDSIGKPQEMNDVRALFKGIAQDLHEFDFKNLDQESVKLLADLKVLFRKIKLEKKEKNRR